MTVDPTPTPRVPGTPDDPDQREPGPTPVPPGPDEPLPVTEPLNEPH